MRIFRHRSVRLARALVLTSVMIAAAGCGGGGSSGTAVPPQNFGVCDPGTQVSLANPQPNTGGVSTGIGHIQIVGNGNTNALYQGYANFDVLLRDQFGNVITGSQLTLVASDNGYKPYPSDFYYNSTIQGLNFGVTYQAFLNIFNSPCQQPVFLGSFST